MLTGIVTFGVVYFGVGLAVKIAKDRTGKTTAIAFRLVKDSIVWPKEIYSYYKKRKPPFKW